MSSIHRRPEGLAGAEPHPRRHFLGISVEMEEDVRPSGRDLLETPAKAALPRFDFPRSIERGVVARDEHRVAWLQIVRGGLEAGSPFPACHYLTTDFDSGERLQLDALLRPEALEQVCAALQEALPPSNRMAAPALRTYVTSHFAWERADGSVRIRVFFPPEDPSRTGGYALAMVQLPEAAQVATAPTEGVRVTLLPAYLPGESDRGGQPWGDSSHFVRGLKVNAPIASSGPILGDSERAPLYETRATPRRVWRDKPGAPPASAWPTTARIPRAVRAAFKHAPGLSPLSARSLRETQSLKAVIDDLSDRERSVGAALVRGDDLTELQSELGLKRGALLDTLSILAFRLGVQGRTGIARAFLSSGAAAPHEPLKLDALNEMQRTMLSLFCEERSEKEVADAMGTTPAGVASRLRDLPASWRAPSRYKLEAMALSAGILPPVGEVIPRFTVEQLSPAEQAAVRERAQGGLPKDTVGHLRNSLRKLGLDHEWQLAPLLPPTEPIELPELATLDRYLMECLAAGWGVSRMAAALGLTERVLNERLSATCTKLGFENRLQAACAMIQSALPGPLPASGVAWAHPRGVASRDWQGAVWRLPEGERAVLELLARGESAQSVRTRLEISAPLFHERLGKIRSKTGISTLEALALRSAWTFVRDTAAAEQARRLEPARVLPAEVRALLEAVVSAQLHRQFDDPPAIVTAMRTLGLTPRPMRARLEAAAREVGFELTLHPDETEVLESQMGLRLAMHALVHHGVGEEALANSEELPPRRDFQSAEQAVLEALVQGKRPAELDQEGSAGSHGVLWAMLDELECNEPYQLMAMALDAGKLPLPREVVERRTELTARMEELPPLAQEAFLAIAKGMPLESIAEQWDTSVEKLRIRLNDWLPQLGLRTAAQIPGFVRALE